jgi:hypothetical protein
VDRGASARAGRSSRPDRAGTWFADERGVDRRLKVSWHPERRLFVLSVWHEDTCTATFRLPLGEVARLVGVLVGVLGDAAEATGPPGPPGPPEAAPSLASRTRAVARTLPDAWRRRSRRRAP